jgi:hypothetical protein
VGVGVDAVLRKTLTGMSVEIDQPREEQTVGEVEVSTGGNLAGRRRAELDA